MGALIPFAYGDALVRVIEIEGEPFWVAKDVAGILGYPRERNMYRLLDDDEKGAHNVRTLGGDQEMVVLSESGLYHAIFNSRIPEAKRFRKWVTSEVLPAIRRDGGYRTPSAERADNWAALSGRIGELERLVTTQALIETEEFANAARFSSPSGRRRSCIEIWVNCGPRKSPNYGRTAMPDEAPARRHVATLENAYRVAQKIADATDQDMQVAATGEPERPFVAEPADHRTRGVVARIVSR